MFAGLIQQHVSKCNLPAKRNAWNKTRLTHIILAGIQRIVNSKTWTTTMESIKPMERNIDTSEDFPICAWKTTCKIASKRDEQIDGNQWWRHKQPSTYRWDDSFVLNVSDEFCCVDDWKQRVMSWFIHFRGIDFELIVVFNLHHSPKATNDIVTTMNTIIIAIIYLWMDRSFWCSIYSGSGSYTITWPE